MEIIGYRIIIRHFTNTQSMINVTRTDLLYGVLSLSIIFGGKMDNKFKRIIELKKLKGSSRKPKYATRKLSVGLVSCMLGYALLVSPSSVEAAGLDSENQAVAEETAETENTSGENKEETPAPAEGEKPADTTENTEALKETETTEEAPEGTPAEETTTEDKEAVVENKEVFSLTDEQRQALKEADYTDSEIAGIEEEIANKLDADANLDAQTLVDEKISEKTPAFEMNEETTPEAVAAPADENREPKDISNDVQSKYVALTEEGHETKGTIKPDNGEAVGWEVSFTSPRGTIAGDYFTIDLSDNLSLKGIEPDHENEYPIEIDGKVVADGVRVDRSTIKYTFNENINDERNVVVSVKGFAYIDKIKVPNNSPKEKISIKVGDTVDEHNINVQYGKTFYTGENLNGMSQITEFNPETGEYTQVFYINPDSKIIGTSTSDDWSANKVAVFIDGVDPKTGSQSDVKYTEDNTKITIHKLKSGEKLPDAIIENPAVNYDDPIYRYKFRDNGIELVFADHNDDKLPSDFIEDPYVVIIKSTAAPSKTGNNIISKGILYGGARQHTMYNDIVTTVGGTEAQGDKIGYFKEHHVYYTKVDGVLQEDKTFTLHSNKTEGYDYDNYFTSKNEIDDFKFVKVDADNLVENPVYNEDGTIARGKYEPGKTKEVTYIYERDVKHGSFQEHHIYQTVDEDGNIIDEKTVTKDGTETTGIDENEYSTSKKDQDGNVVTDEKDKDGYKLVEVKATNEDSAKLGVKFDNQGAATCGNYVNGEKLEVTYIYQKKEAKPWTPIEETGKFQEHHVYRTLDKDGKVIKEEKVDGDVTGGTSKMTYTTGKIDKDGFEYKRTETPVEDPTFNEDGSKATGNFKPGVTQEITYVYEKTQTDWTPIEETGKFQEHHVYRTLDKDGKVIKEEKVDGDVTGGTSKMTYTTGKKDKDGFKFVRTENPVENPTFDENGETTEGNYKPGVTQEITYVYEKTESEWTPIEETGKFQEHHIYITKDKDGKEIKREVVDGKVSGGTKDMTYTTGKDEKDGFKFVRTENPVEEPTFNEKGETTEGNYKPGVTQEITYVYEKTESEWTPIEETGKFQEHHIYITKDKDGKEIKREVVDGKVSGGTKDMTYTTGKDEKDGFKFVRTENPVEDPSYNEKGETTTGNFRPGVKQEITYVYERTETPWTPLEPSEPVEPGTPGETPDIPWTPLEPSEPVEPGTPGETPETPDKPETPEKPENPDKPEKPGKENPTSPEGEKDKKENKVQVPVVEAKKEIKKETPVRKNGNPKTGVGSISGAALGLIAAASGLFVSKKNKDEE